jgi:uncharacterized membrane protein YdbT with pleckstrin-like domain
MNLKDLEYINRNLIKDEVVELRTNLHWINFINLKSVLSLGIIPYIDYRFSEFAITSKRVIIKTGIINIDTFEMNLSKVETINVNQSILGRLLGYGDITIIGTGGSTKKFDNISNPMEFRKKFVELTF